MTNCFGLWYIDTRSIQDNDLITRLKNGYKVAYTLNIESIDRAVDHSLG